MTEHGNSKKSSHQVTIKLEDLQLLHMAARRYCDTRMSYVVGSFNDVTRRLLADNIDLKTKEVDGTYFAADGMGKAYSSLSQEEYDEVVASRK